MRSLIASFILIAAFGIAPPAHAQGAQEVTEVESTEVSIDLQVPVGGTREVGTINEYIQVAYEFSGVFILSIAIIAIMIGGVMWLTSGGNVARISQARTIIISAITGTVLYLLSYTILSLVNPDLVRLRPLTGLNTLDRIDFESLESILPGRIPEAPNLVQIQGTNIIVAASDPRITSELLPDVQAAALDLQAQGFDFILSSAYRDPAIQQQLIEQNCTGVSCSGFTCEVTGSCSPPTCRLSNGPQSCPHTTGRAVDAWGGKNGAQCIRLSSCVADKQSCAENECQKALITAMRNQGFCRLCAEPWHFEKPKMSACCN